MTNGVAYRFFTFRHCERSEAIFACFTHNANYQIQLFELPDLRIVRLPCHSSIASRNDKSAVVIARYEAILWFRNQEHLLFYSESTNTLMNRGKGGCVYLLTNFKNTVIYTGVTSDLIARVTQHKDGFYPNSFTSKYRVNKLVYFESFHSIEEAIAREKQIKGGSRQNKISLIESTNKEWKDLYSEILKW